MRIQRNRWRAHTAGSSDGFNQTIEGFDSPFVEIDMMNLTQNLH